MKEYTAQCILLTALLTVLKPLGNANYFLVRLFQIDSLCVIDE